MSFKGNYEQAIDKLDLIYGEDYVNSQEDKLTELYSLCSETEPFHLIADLMLEYQLTPVKAIKLYHVIEEGY